MSSRRNTPSCLAAANDPLRPGAYRRYLVNQLRAAYGFVGTLIRLVLKGKHGS